MSFGHNTRKLKSVEDGKYEILTPIPGPNPHINSLFIYGCQPGHPFFYRMPCKGDRPISFSAEALPRGLILGAVTGIIQGNTPVQGEYIMFLMQRTNMV
jgi:alpha-galactosidase